MISKVILLCVLVVYNSAFNLDKFNQYEFSSKPECEADKVYRKDDITCFCNKYGRWPHKNCSLTFDQHPVCEPNSYIQVDCNVCRCSKTGTVEREFCTNHVCSTDQENIVVLRRYNDGQKKCELNHWYEISTCRLCICITKDNLLCAAETHPKKVTLSKYNLTDCGSEWLHDVNKLLSSVKPLRLGNKNDLDDPENQGDTETVGGQRIILTQSEPEAPIKAPKRIFQTSNLEHETNANKKVKIGRNDDRSDGNDIASTSESNSEEKVEADKAIARIAGNTVMPFENIEDNDSNNSYEIESDRKESDNELADSETELKEVDATKEVESRIDNNKNERSVVRNEVDNKSDESLLKLSLPGMLGKVFNFGSRKSMVSLTDSACVPGTTLTVECNACFCLTNGKLLCTKKIC